jgi:hypothetical protein
MKIYVDKTKVKREDLELVTELFFTYPLLSQQAKNHINENRFWESGIFNNIEGLEYADEVNCDYFALPFKFKDSKEDRFLELLDKSRHYGKRLICLNNDDFGGDYNIPDDIVLFRTSFYASQRKSNEFAFPVFVPDINQHSKGFSNNVSVGFCGDSNRPIRKEALNILKKSNIKVNHDEIFSFFQNPYEDKKTGRDRFFKNLQENIFILTPRGCGNFSYRFYETMCFGRIPVFVNTDCVLPFENLIDYKNEIVFVEENELEKIPEKIMEYCDKYDLVERQQRCRDIWLKYLSSSSFAKHIETLL